MIHANKMILVPHELAGESESASRYLSNLDREMLHILHDDSLPIDAKVLQYNQILHRYQNAKQDMEKPFQLEIKESEPKSVEVVEKKGEDQQKIDAVEEAVLETVPKKWRKQASLLLKHVRKSPHVKWSETGEMVVDGNKIVGSNIVDLINDFSRPRNIAPAVGADIFLKKMVEANIPKETIVNKKRLSLVEKDIYASTQAPTPTKSDSSQSSTPSTLEKIKRQSPATPSTSEKIKRQTRSMFSKWTNIVA